MRSELVSLFGRPIVEEAERLDPDTVNPSDIAPMRKVVSGLQGYTTEPRVQRAIVDAMPKQQAIVLCWWLMTTDAIKQSLGSDIGR
jgi:hypothetical protein